MTEMFCVGDWIRVERYLPPRYKWWGLILLDEEFDYYAKITEVTGTTIDIEV